MDKTPENKVLSKISERQSYMDKLRYSVDISNNDIKRAKEAYEQGKYSFNYIDPMRFKIVEHYLSHFSNEPHNTKEILEESLMHSIIDKDDYLKIICHPERLIPESFNEVCDFIGSIIS